MDTESSFKTPGKRSKIVVTLEKKVQALELLKDGCKAVEVAKLYGVGKSTVRDWVKFEDILRDQAKSVKSASTVKIVKKKRKPSNLSASGKRVKIVVTLDKKLEALDLLSNGYSTIEVAKVYGVGETTVRDWRKAAKMLRMQASTVKNTEEVKIVKKAGNETMEYMLLDWIEHAKQEGMALSPSVICKKARDLHESTKETAPCTSSMQDFSASPAWFKRFCNRHDVHLEKSYHELSYNEYELTKKFKKEFGKLSLQYSHHQIFNVDQTILFWKMLPSKLLPNIEQHSEKYMNNKVSLLLCANSSGDFKFPPACVYNINQLKLFENISDINVWWRANQSISFTQQYFEEWVTQEFIPTVSLYLSEKGLPKKALIVLDGSTKYSVRFLQKFDINYRTIFFPEITTVQPTMKGITTLFKRYYISTMLKILTPIDCDSNLHNIKLNNSSDSYSCSVNALKEKWLQFTLLDCIHLINEAWNNIGETQLSASWNKFTYEINDFGRFPDIIALSAVNDSALTELLRKTPRGEGLTLEDIHKYLKGFTESFFKLDKNDDIHKFKQQNKEIAQCLKFTMDKIICKDNDSNRSQAACFYLEKAYQLYCDSTYECKELDLSHNNSSILDDDDDDGRVEEVECSPDVMPVIENANIGKIFNI